MPADADAHRIPACERKNEDGHWHFDLRFAFLFGGDPGVSVDRSESLGYRWVTLGELEAMPDFGRIARRLAVRTGAIPGLCAGGFPLPPGRRMDAAAKLFRSLFGRIGELIYFCTFMHGTFRRGILGRCR